MEKAIHLINKYTESFLALTKEEAEKIKWMWEHGEFVLQHVDRQNLKWEQLLDNNELRLSDQEYKAAKLIIGKI